MRRPYHLGRFAGLEIHVKRSTIPASGSLWVLFSLVTHFFLELEWAPAVLAGLAGVLLHYFSETWHQLGHAAAARRTGHPMQGILVYGFLAASVYPPGEQELPAAVHVRRALAGPANSLILAVLAGLLLFLLRPENRTAAALLWLVFLDNLFVFCLGALLPLGFTDGSTLLRYWARR